MKHLLVMTTVLAFLCFSAYGQTSKEVPPIVKAAFAKKFPGATDAKWNNEDNKDWGAEFKLNGKDLSANFDNKGMWAKTKYQIDSKEIPEAVNNTIKKDFSGYKIEKSEMTESKDTKVYDFVLEKAKEKIEVVIAHDGKVVKKEAKSESKAIKVEPKAVKTEPKAGGK
ncbi:MAG: PepSY-like domain-containing protein [Candidatus Delongbacteria bacterium]|nr:PepSY-like domain-containing protein [Candidatus Delongbacteria bacterium]MDD4204496.1 PepSY-like domain-containing protein [Candidatus Delongbacteria bacterium]